MRRKRRTTRIVFNKKSSGISDIRESRAQNSNLCESVQSVVCNIFGRADPAPTAITRAVTMTITKRASIKDALMTPANPADSRRLVFLGTACLYSPPLRAERNRSSACENCRFIGTNESLLLGEGLLGVGLLFNNILLSALDVDPPFWFAVQAAACEVVDSRVGSCSVGCNAVYSVRVVIIFQVKTLVAKVA